MQLLFFLSAMLASLTGLVSGDRAVEPRQVEQAIATAASVAEAAPATAEMAVRAETPASAAPVAVRTFHPLSADALPNRARVDERRLE